MHRFFDNVGGTILETVMLQMNPHGTVVVVGAISQYSSLDTGGAYLKSCLPLMMNRLSLVGFTVFDHPELAAEAAHKLVQAVQEGKLLVGEAETVVDVKGRVEEIPRVWNGLFKGSNTGKLITKFAD